jgi:hypothetical protein
MRRSARAAGWGLVARRGSGDSHRRRVPRTRGRSVRPVSWLGDGRCPSDPRCLRGAGAAGQDRKQGAGGCAGHCAEAWFHGREWAPAVMACSPDEYRTLGRTVDRVAQPEMLPLSGDGAAGYLRGQFLDHAGFQEWVILTAGAPGISAEYRAPGRRQL